MQAIFDAIKLALTEPESHQVGGSHNSKLLSKAEAVELGKAFILDNREFHLIRFKPEGCTYRVEVKAPCGYYLFVIGR